MRYHQIEPCVTVPFVTVFGDTLHPDMPEKTREKVHLKMKELEGFSNLRVATRWRMSSKMSLSMSLEWLELLGSIASVFLCPVH